MDDSSLIPMSEELNSGDNLTLMNGGSGEDDVLSASNVYINAPDVTKYYHGPERFVVKLYDNNGYSISGELVKITINGNTYNKYTDTSGEASIALNLNSGTYQVTTSCSGKYVYSTVTVKDTVIADDFTKMYKSSTQYEAIFVDSNGQRLPYNTPIRININGVYYTKYTNSNGVARMNINLNPGTYTLTATNPSTGEMHATKITVKTTIVENHDLTKYYKNGSQYSLRLLGDDGRPVGAGVSVKLNINGVIYTKTSDSNGYVRMSINLNPGTYIITADYNGLKASNTIKVLSVLSANDLYMTYGDGSAFSVKLLNGKGNAYSGQTVTFNINGVFYNKVTDSNGNAKLNINLKPGTYTITASYNGLNVAKKVVVKSNTNSNTGGSSNKDSGYVYISLPSYDTTVTKKVGAYTIEVEQWRTPGLGELDIYVTKNGNFVSKYTVESKISDGSTWSGTYSSYERATYHKWHFDPDVRIRQVAVQLLNTQWS